MSVGTITDADKKAKSLESWTAADTAFKANNIDECNARIGDTGKNMDKGSDAGSTTTQ